MTVALLKLRTWISSRLPGRDDDRGASLVEYALLLALIALVAIGAVTFLGGATTLASRAGPLVRQLDRSSPWPRRPGSG